MGSMSSITDIVSVVQLQGHSRPFRGGIELPVEGERIYGDRLDVEGWAIGEKAPVAAVEVLLDGRVVQRAPLSIPRHDLVDAYLDSNGGPLGFSFVLAAPRVQSYELHLRAVYADESSRRLGTIHGRHRMRDCPAGAPFVSVAIPCHNQARFITEAISSVLGQTYQNFEVVVVDDGSVDGSPDIAEGLGIRCVRQARRGPSGARNAGFRATSGEYVVFLDGDNRLHPHGLEANLHAFEDRPESAFVGGRYSYIDEFGARHHGKLPDPCARQDHYAALLAENYFGSPDNVMFRRSVLDAVGVFDASVDGLEDYDLYLRIARDRPVHYHSVAISEYRVHGTQFSRDQAMMLRSAVRVLRRHRRVAAKDPALRGAYRQGLAHWRGAYGRSLSNQLRTALRERQWSEARKLALSLLRWHPAGLLSLAKALRR
jgi:glycosyltransferase involved in cell wall biosynthesis